MNGSKRRHHGEGGDGAHIPQDRPYWQRAHRDWRFWLGTSLFVAAITLYVMSDDLSVHFLVH